jgi:hypothetical protein
MHSFESVLIAHWFLAPATTLMWCRLLLDNPAERVVKAWSQAMLQHVMLSTSIAGRVSQTEAIAQVHHCPLVPASAAAGEYTTIIEFSRHRSKARASVADEVGHDRCKILRMPVRVGRDRIA